MICPRKFERILETEAGSNHAGLSLEVAVPATLTVARCWSIPGSPPLLGASVSRSCYLLARNDTRLFVVLSTILLASVPAAITGEPDDGLLRDVTLGALVPLYLRLWTWWDRASRWDLLDPVVIFTAPVWFVGLTITVLRLNDILNAFG
ncbi:MAG: hypothetical protein U0790_07560 [Isosphaeraceae bacterium]